MLCWGNSIRERNARKTQRKAENVTEDIKENYEQVEEISIVEEAEEEENDIPKEAEEEKAYLELLNGHIQYSFDDDQKEIFKESTEYIIKDLNHDGISEMVVKGDKAFFLFTYDMEQKDINLVQAESLDYGDMFSELDLTSDNMIRVHVWLDWTNQKGHIYQFRKFNGLDFDDIINFADWNESSGWHSEGYEINEETVTYEEWLAVYKKYVSEKELDEEWEKLSIN